MNAIRSRLNAIARRSSNHRNAHRGQLGIEKVRAVRRRMHPTHMNHIGRRPLGNIFGNFSEARARQSPAILQRRLARKLVRQRVSLRHQKRVVPRRARQRLVPPQQRQTLCHPFAIR